MKALYAAASGMAAQQIRLDNISNNLANVNTTGFKKAREDFQDLFYQALTSGGQGISNARVEVGSGVRLASLEKEHSQGQMLQSSNPLDVAIQGPGLMAVETAEGTKLYTRDGSFTKGADGMLVTNAGLKVAGDIVVPPDAINVRVQEDGTVQALFDGEVDYTTLGQIEVSTFTNPNGLRPLGGNLYAESPESGVANQVSDFSNTKVLGGYLEGSNVDIAEELIQMIMAQRAFELNSKAIQASDETMGIAVNLKR